jgi:outer membrane protein
MRRRTLLIALAFLATGAAGASGQATTPLRIGYVNSAVLMDEAPGAQEASQQFNRDLQGFQAEIQRLGEQLQQMIEQYDRQQLTLSPTAKTQREADIRRGQQEYQQRMDALEEQATRRQQELVQPVMDRVTRVIEQLRTEGNYALILDVAAGSIIAADPALDLTAEVLRRLRATAGGR